MAVGTVRFQIEEGGDFSKSSRDLAREAADVQIELDMLRGQTVSVVCRGPLAESAVANLALPDGCGMSAGSCA